jgi:CspA family cold shock protein
MTGTIKKLTNSGYGFIGQGDEAEGEEEQDDIFFHASSLQDGLNFDELEEGEEVTFETEVTDKGPSAVNVALA